MIVTGSHGFVGSDLVDALRSQGDHVTRLVRGSPATPDEVRWDPAGGAIDADALEDHDAAVHLAGAGIGDHRWTEAYKDEILASRVEGTTLLAETLARLHKPPSVLVSASAIGFYGDRGDETLTEGSALGDGFIAHVVRQWEQSTRPAEEAGIRVVHIRSGIVLSPKGGTLKRLLLPFRLGVGGRLASGRQWTSWIALDDELRAVSHVISDERARGPVNLVAPHPVTNSELSRTLGRVMRRPSLFPVPLFALKLVLSSGLAREITGSQRVVPTELERLGFRFDWPDLEPALRHLLAK